MAPCAGYGQLSPGGGGLRGGLLREYSPEPYHSAQWNGSVCRTWAAPTRWRRAPRRPLPRRAPRAPLRGTTRSSTARWGGTLRATARRSCAWGPRPPSPATSSGTV
eukprot:7279748-Pyramimonas_sp.AAC.1